jgi:hypothetical protein
LEAELAAERAGSARVRGELAEAQTRIAELEAQVDKADRQVPHEPECCAGCRAVARTRIGRHHTHLPTGRPRPQTVGTTNLARRLLNRQHDYLRFTADPQIPPDNNGSERDIRMIKLRAESLRLPARPHRSQTLLHHTKLLSTAAKHGLGFYDALVQLAEGHPWLPLTA